MKLRIGQYPPMQVFMSYVLEGIADLYPEIARIAHLLEVFLLSDQDTLNAYVARLVAAQTAVAAEITALKAQPGAAALDFSGLDSVVSGFEGLEPPAADAPAPVDGSADATDVAAAAGS